MGISNFSSGLRPGVCTSTTRPTTPYKGQMIYETDTDMVAIYNGTAWRYIAATTPTSGTVLQVASATKTDTQIITTSFTDVSSLSVSITPKSTSSKVLVWGQVDASGQVGTGAGFMRIMRDTTAVGVGAAAGSRSQATSYFGRSIDTGSSGNAAFSYLDSPSTTSAITYKIQARSESGNLYVNRNQSDGDLAANGRTVSTITVMEIAG